MNDNKQKGLIRLRILSEKYDLDVDFMIFYAVHFSWSNLNW